VDEGTTTMMLKKTDKETNISKLTNSRLSFFTCNGMKMKGVE
jgi:hypothetical protein